ncbi:TRAP transporter substrate-binding protein DctP [Paracoccus pantotrophus]|uniref:TRAP transporter substrate-binding protein DctP n=1 Tax=Paracoccus pantotrophus TaxID=82367 RepID=A0A7H9BT57_PARPN|nr:TRAP transporter substrate-binding protein DctP [Paracoccus pantotrophus]QLH13041.1 TRAP transporter substrate-binding protein DctP [Paracoccus pantotrophus]
MKFSNRMAAACCLVGLCAGMAQAEDVTLRFGTLIAASAPGVTEGANVFKRIAGELSDGSVNVQVFPGEQAGKVTQTLDLVQSGALDIGVLTSALYSSDRLPLMGLLELPGVSASLCEVAGAMVDLSAPGELIYENDLVPNGIRILAYMPYPPYGPAATRVPVDDIEDLKGLRLRNAGGLMEYTTAALGGVPVRMSAPEVYQSLQRGTIDGVLFSFLSVKSYDLASVAKHGATGFSFGTPGDLVIMSERRFQSLAPEQQEALVEAGRQTSQHWCEYVQKSELEDMAEMREAGMDIHTWTPEQVEQLTEVTASVSKTWAETLDARGVPGTEALAAFRERLSQ